jgi:hypothetical protein
MFDPETNTVIDRLERARRWWKSLLLAPWPFSSWFSQLGRPRSFLNGSKSKWSKSELSKAQSEQARRVLYYHQISLAEREWAATR